MYDHQLNGARARSARIRLAHDDEATRLDTMRRLSLPVETRGNRALAIRRFTGALARLHRRGRARAQDLHADCEPG
jgi:hypothetical protein